MYNLILLIAISILLNGEDITERVTRGKKQSNEDTIGYLRARLNIEQEERRLSMRLTAPSAPTPQVTPKKVG
jgi:hypothetical protein